MPDGSRWAFEVKHDGFRFIARRDGDRVRVFSRNAKDWTDKVPLIVEAMLALPVLSATIDGEGVVVDKRGVTDFERLRTALAERNGSRAAFLYGFDLLELDGEDLRRHPWEIRRATLTRLLRKTRPGVWLSELVSEWARGWTLLALAKKARLFGTDGKMLGPWLGMKSISISTDERSSLIILVATKVLNGNT